MTTEERHLELVWDLTTRVVERCLPDQSDVLRPLWQWWLLHRDSMLAVAGDGMGMPAAPHGASAAVAEIIVALDRVALEIRQTGCLPSRDEFDCAVLDRAVGPSPQGARRTFLLRVCQATFERLQELSLDGKARIPLAARASWFVQELSGGVVQEPREVHALERWRVIPAGWLLIDEPKRVIQAGQAKPVPIRDYHVRETKGLWLLLRWSNGSFDYEKIRADCLGGRTVVDSALRKYATDGAKLVEDILGVQVLQRAKRGEYGVSGDAWCWRWIRSSREPGESTLLASRG